MDELVSYLTFYERDNKEKKQKKGMKSCMPWIGIKRRGIDKKVLVCMQK